MADIPARSAMKKGALPWQNYPAWWKVAAAFAVGAVIAGASLVKVLPEGAANRAGGGLGSLGLPEGEVGAGEPGSSEEFIIDPKTGQIVRRTGGGTASGAAGTSGTAGSAGQAGGKSSAGASLGGGTGGSSGVGQNPDGSPISCAANKNGGATAVGVTATNIKLGAPVAESGIAQAFLGEVSFAMKALRDKVNGSAEKICGRTLTILFPDDGWEPDRGFTNIKNLVEQEKVFALAVAPSSEGVNAASLANYFSNNKVPVVGSDGMIKTQYSDPYIWPVASATITQMHVMMKNAWDRGARNPAIVFENNYRFGVEGANAFNQAYKRLAGLPETHAGLGSGTTCSGRYCGISSEGGQYSAQVSAINSACAGGTPCDFMALLLEPITALNWMGTSGAKQPKDFSTDPARPGMGTAQPLFTYNFGDTCHDKCNGMWVWTGYNPPWEQYKNTQAVAEYVADLDSKCVACDESNQFTEGGYLGMKLLIKALKATPNLTRENLKATLNSMTLDTGLSPPLSWSASNHYANPAAQAFAFNSKNGFTGFAFKQGYVNDPWLGQDG